MREKLAGPATGFIFTVVIPLLVGAMSPQLSLAAGIPIIGFSILIGISILVLGFSNHQARNWRGKILALIIMSSGMAIYLVGGFLYYSSHSTAPKRIVNSEKKPLDTLAPPASVSLQDAGTTILIIKAHNFAKSLREFRSDYIADDKKWNDLEWEEFRNNEDKSKSDEIRSNNNQKRQGRQQTFTNRFHQVYKSYAVELSDRLTEQLRAIGVVPLTPGFSTPLPPGFDTFKVTIESPAVRFAVTENLVARMADYFDGLANQFPHEVGDEPSKVP